jgi:hypothetical protein
MTVTDTERDIFGDPQTEPDISSEGLEWEADDDLEPASITTGEGDDNTNAEGDEPEAGDDEPEAPEADDADKGEEAPAADDEELPEDLRGKTPAELAKIIADSQAMIQRQADEVGQARRMMEQFAAQQQAAQQHEPVPASEYIDNVQDGLLAYREGIGLLDQGQVGPSAIDDIIDVVRELDPATAAKMDRDFGMRLARAEMNVQMAPVIEQSYNASLQAAAAQVNADPDATAYREDIVRIVQQPANMVEQQVAQAYQHARTAPELTAALNAALTVARGANPVKSLTYKQQLEAAKQNEQVEGGNSSQAEPPKTEAQRITESLLSMTSGSDELFAGFGG